MLHRRVELGERVVFLHAAQVELDLGVLHGRQRRFVEEVHGMSFRGGEYRRFCAESSPPPFRIFLARKCPSRKRTYFAIFYKNFIFNYQYVKQLTLTM